jgi:hypothetical protein
MKVLGQDGRKDTGQKDIEQIEERPDPGNDHDGAVDSRDRQPIQARGDRRAHVDSGLCLKCNRA